MTAPAALPCLLLPGLLCDRALWAPQLEALGDRARFVVPELWHDDSMAGMAECALRSLPDGPFAVAGLSMGGYVALEILRRVPARVRGLALLDTQARPDVPEVRQRRLDLLELSARARSLAPVQRRMYPLLVHADRLGDAALAATVDGMAERVGLQGYVRQQRAILERPDSRPGLSSIRCTTLVLCGRDDQITPVAVHEEIAQAIPGARLEVIEHCGHLATLECPEAVNSALARWLETLGAPH